MKDVIYHRSNIHDAQYHEVTGGDA